MLGSGEPWKTVDTLKAFNWLNWYGGKFSTSPEARRLHGPGAGDAAGRLLALVPDGLWAGGLRRGLHLGAVPVDDEQGPGRRAGQFRQPHRQVRRVQVRRRRARRRRTRPAGSQAGRRHPRRRRRGDRGLRGHGVPQGLPGPARRLGAGQRVSAGSRALDRVQDRCRSRRRRRPHRPEPRRPVRPHRRAGHARSRPRRSPPPSARPTCSWPAVDAALLDQLPRGQKVAAAEVLFKKIEDVQVAEWTERFGGAQ